MYINQKLDPIFDSLKDVTLEGIELCPIESLPGPKLFGELNGMYGLKHTNKTKALQSKAKQGKIPAKDLFGNNIIADKSDPRWKTGEIVGLNKGKSITKRKVYKLSSQTDTYEVDFHQFVSISKVNKLCLASLYNTIKSGKTTKQGWKLEVFDLIQK
jgi:hypothetical protein